MRRRSSAAVERAASELGGLDILVNNAGIATMAPIDRFSLEDFDRTFAINVRADLRRHAGGDPAMGEGGRS